MSLWIPQRKAMFLGSQVAAVATPAFAPTDILGLKAWWDAAAANITKDGSNFVSSWADKSGSTRTAAQATGASQPLWVASGVNGIPVVRFDGSDDQLTFTTTALAAYSLFVVMKTISVVKQYSGPLGWRKTGEAGFQFPSEATVFEGAGLWQPHLVQWNGAAETANISAAPKVTIANNTFNIHNFVSTPNYYQDGTLGTMPNGGGSGYGPDNAAIGKAYDFWNGDVAEILVYDSVLSSTDRASVITYLKAKFGIA